MITNSYELLTIIIFKFYTYILKIIEYLIAKDTQYYDLNQLSNLMHITNSLLLITVSVTVSVCYGYDKQFIKQEPIFYIVDLHSQPSDDPTINAVIFNDLDINMTFTNCNITGGKQIYKILDPLVSGSKQPLKFEKLYPNVLLISGECHYNLCFNCTVHDKKLNSNCVVLDVIFFRNSQDGYEFYGLTNDLMYNVEIKIESPGHVAFFIWN